MSHGGLARQVCLKQEDVSEVWRKKAIWLLTSQPIPYSEYMSLWCLEMAHNTWFTRGPDLIGLMQTEGFSFDDSLRQQINLKYRVESVAIIVVQPTSSGNTIELESIK